MTETCVLCKQEIDNPTIYGESTAGRRLYICDKCWRDYKEKQYAEFWEHSVKLPGNIEDWEVRTPNV